MLAAPVFQLIDDPSIDCSYPMKEAQFNKIWNIAEAAPYGKVSLLAVKELTKGRERRQFLMNPLEDVDN